MRETTPDPSLVLERGRRACERREWRAAHESLARADAEKPLDADDLWLLALSGYLIGRDSAYLDALERAHRLQLEAADAPAAARSAFWLGFLLADRGETARASGWFGRASRILDREKGEHVERGYLLLAAGHGCFAAGEAAAAYAHGAEAVQLAERFGDRDLLALAVHLQGRALLIEGRVREGLALLDEAMVAVGTDELSPQVTGLIYCSVLGACRSVHALSRAEEWTAALDEWCKRQPDLVPYTSECRVYRAELMHFRGAWHAALEEALRAGVNTRGGSGPAVALALYQQGESRRLLGEFAAAEAAFRAASDAGREPQPGLALLRLAQGDEAAAAGTIRRALAETRDPLMRSRLLPAHVEIMLAIGEPGEARRSCEELQALAGTYESAVLAASAAHARGAVLLAAGEPDAALSSLRRAWQEWHAMNAPYEAARARALLGLACHAVGDDETSASELAAARAEFQRLGAAPEIDRLDELTRRPSPRRAHGLTPRELAVLALVATGKTNRAVADALFISERTVARHVSNIFRKLGLPSRSAATAYAYEHHLLSRTT
jgi:DNA-binding NarL/FixJ family response regulator